MPLTFTTTAPGGNTDYQKYLYSQPVKNDRKNSPDEFDFTLIPYDASFVKLVRGNYIKFDTVTYPNWFTGFITNDPELEFIGTSSTHLPVFGYKYKAISDEYILNLKPIGIIPPFTNATQGSILTFLVNRLVPGMFDTSNIAAGLTMARYIADPQHKFSDVVKLFCDNAQFRFRANNKFLYFVAQDLTPCGITVDGSSKHFTPSRLSLVPTSDPIINEAVVLGDVEPQGYYNEYFYGDGFTAQFPLTASPYGVDRTILINEDFQSSSLNGTYWNEVDNASDYLRIATGYLNAVGGNNTNAFDIYLQSQQLIPLEGSLRLTHGEFDFVNAGSINTIQGIVAGLWTGNPVRVSDTSFTGCIFGIRVQRDASGNAFLRPIYNSAVDLSNQIAVDYTKRYIIRTLMNTVFYRAVHKYNYLTVAGTVASRGGYFTPSTLSFTTIVTEISTVDGTQSNQWTLAGTAAVGSGTYYAYYCPLVSNDLHCTVSGITISTPMQLQLEIQPSGGSFVQKLVGHNELDSLDNNAPTATIVDGNTGLQTRSSVLGSPQLNPGNALLTFFKDSTKQTSTTPQRGDLLHLAYRRAGAAMAKARAASAVSVEGTLWGDNGVRSVVRGDLMPKPRTSADCEAAASALIGDSAYQHYQGTYEQFSTYFTQEPLAGTVLPFANLPAGMPSVQAEEISGVQTTMVSSHPTELFRHQLTFGKADLVQRFLAKYTQQTDIFQPQDSVEVPTYVDPVSIGSTFAPDVIAPTFVSMTSSNLTLNTNQAAPAGGGFEVRYTDECWGPDTGKNLVARSSSQVITVPRNYRNRLCFVKAYDARNYITDSEAVNLWNVYSATVTMASELNPDGNISQIGTVALTAGSGIIAPAATGVAPSNTWCASISLKGTSGNTVTVQLDSGNGTTTGTTVVTLNGQWQRITTFGTFSALATGPPLLQVLSNTPTTQTVRMTRASIESGTVETAYCKTVGGAYGALSRYASCVRVNFPLVPPAPTATLDKTDLTNLKVNIVLPTLQQDVWGVEIRASDNITVNYKKDLTDPQYTASPIMPIWAGNGSVSYYVYTYNLLGEYCATPYNLTEAVYGVPALVASQTGVTVFNETFEMFENTNPTTLHNNYNIRSGNTSGASITTNGQMGGKAFKTTAQAIWMASPYNIPFDPSKLYRMRCRARKVSGTNNTNFYVGVEGIRADGVTLCNYAGLPSNNSQAYVCVGGWNLSPNNTWTDFTGYFKGVTLGEYTDLVVDGVLNTKVTSASRTFTSVDVGTILGITGGAGWTANAYTINSVSAGAAILSASPAVVGTTGGVWGIAATYSPATDPNAPTRMYAATRYMRPLFILDYSSGLDTWEMDYMAIDIIPDNLTNVPAGTAALSYRPTTQPLTAQDSGGIPVVTIAGHVMRAAGLGDVTNAAGSSNATSGDYSKSAFIYYDDPNFLGNSGGTYSLTFTKEVALQGGGRFFVGSIQLPSSGGSSTVGNNDGGTGAQFGKDTRILPGAYTAPSWSNPLFAIDADKSNFAFASTSGAPLTFEANTFPSFASWFSKNSLVIVHQLYALSGTANAYIDYSIDDGATWVNARTISAADAASVTTTIPLLLNQRTDKVRARMVIPASTTGGSGSSALNAGTCVDDATVGTKSWGTPTNAQGASDSLVSSASSTAVFATTHYLKATNFGFAIPTNATINGISVTINRKGTFDDGTVSGFFRDVEDNTIKLVIGGVVSGTNQAVANSWNSVLTAASYGGSTSLWGLTPTYTDINGTTFGVVIAANISQDSGSSIIVTAAVDSILITVYYTTTGGAATSSTGRLYYVGQEVSL